MKNIQRKLENIRSVFENQQNAYKISKDRPEGAVQRMIPAPESVMRARTIFFSPKHGKAACFLTCYASFGLLLFPLMNMMLLLNSFSILINFKTI